MPLRVTGCHRHRKGSTRLDRDLPQRRPLTPADAEAWDDELEDEPERGSLLDRAIVLPVATGRWLAVAVTLLVGVLLRYLGLDRWPLSVRGADLAYAAHNLVRGEHVPNNLLGAPFAIEWTGLFLFIGGSSDAVARLAAATAGVLVIVAALRL